MVFKYFVRLFPEEKEVEDEEEEMMAIDEVGADDETKVITCIQNMYSTIV